MDKSTASHILHQTKYWSMKSYFWRLLEMESFYVFFFCNSIPIQIVVSFIIFTVWSTLSKNIQEKHTKIIMLLGILKYKSAILNYN